MNTLDRADDATDRDAHAVHVVPTKDRDPTWYPVTGDPFPVAVDQATVTRAFPAVAFTPGTTPGNPTRTNAAADHGPNPFEFDARTRAWCSDPFTPATARARTVGPTVATVAHADQDLDFVEYVRWAT